MAPDSHSEVTQSKRLVSVDALRGFDMFWIVGGTGFFAALFKFFSEPVQEILLPQLDHAEWAGFRVYDLIFPLFVFMVGMSTVFSLEKLLQQNNKAAAYQRLIRRFVGLMLLGILYYGGLANEWPEIRLLGVLQRLALSYLFTGILFIHFRLRGMLVAFGLLLVSYWALLSFVPVPGTGEISFEAGKNWSNYLDSKYLIGRRHDGEWDPEGLLSTLPSIASCLLGVFAALFIRNQNYSANKKVMYLVLGGLAGVVFGFLWGIQFPVIKKIWTSSYVLVSGGYSLMLLGIFYWLVDVKGWQKWAMPFVWIGMNPITIYVARNILDFNRLATRFAGGDLFLLLGDLWGTLLLRTVSVGLSFLLVYFLYKKKIFLRL